MHVVKHKSALKNRVHSTLVNFGRACPVTDLFVAEGRRLLDRLQVPEPWRVTASVCLIDDLERQIADINRRLKDGHADHPYIPLLLSVPRNRLGSSGTAAEDRRISVGDGLGSRIKCPARAHGFAGFAAREPFAQISSPVGGHTAQFGFAHWQ